MKTGLDAGPTAVLAFDNFTVVVFSLSLSLFDRAMYYANGLDPQDFDLIVVKSPHTEHHMYDAWVDNNFNVDVAGATSANLRSLGHTICARLSARMAFCWSTWGRFLAMTWSARRCGWTRCRRHAQCGWKSRFTPMRWSRTAPWRRVAAA